jgi:uncharacterized membrane protein YeaQ/YmgE (transglycosylase-associated protein family)
MHLIGFLIVGLVAGWLAGLITKGRGFGLAVNLVVGVVGSFVGVFVFGLLGLSSHGFIGSLITATVGAVVLLFIISAFKKV